MKVSVERCSYLVCISCNVYHIQVHILSTFPNYNVPVRLFLLNVILYVLHLHLKNSKQGNAMSQSGSSCYERERIWQKLYLYDSFVFLYILVPHFHS